MTVAARLKDYPALVGVYRPGMGEALSKRERGRLAELESVVERGLETFVQVGNALMEIRDAGLYRETHATFEEYLDQRWGWSRGHGYRLINHAKVAALVSPVGDIPNERQARELAPLLRKGEDVVLAVWRELREKYGDRVTAEKVRVAVSEKLRYEGTVRALVSSASQEWYTPSEYIEAAREVLGGIDLDPASSEEANRTVRAARFYTEQDDGLTKEWRGRVWMNPPYGAVCGAFVDKLVKSYEEYALVEAAIICLNGRSFDARWFQQLGAYPICSTDHRPKFRNPFRDEHDRPTVGTIFVYIGPDPDAFVRVFSRFGTVRPPDATRNDRTAFGRMLLNDQRELLRAEEERLFGASEMPERDVVTEGVGWSPARLDEEWALLGREEDRIRQREAAD